MDPARVLKVAVVGCGKIADAHVEEVRKLRGAALVAACDVELLMAEQLAVRYQIPRFYDDFSVLLEKESPDVVHITTPPESHQPLAIQAMSAGCHVYIEKPIAPTCDGARAIIDLANQLGKKLTVGFAYEFDPVTLRLRSLLRRGILGDPTHVESYFGYSLSGTYGSAVFRSASHWVHKLPGKIVQNNLDHALHKITDFIRDENPLIEAVGFRRRPEGFGDVRDEAIDELRVVVVGSDTSGYVTFTSQARPVSHFLRVYGTKRTAHVDYVSRTVIVETGPRLPTAVGRILPPFSQSWHLFGEAAKNTFRFARSDFHFFAGMNRLIDLFYKSIRDDGEVPIPYEKILRVSAIADEIYRQVNEKRERVGE